MNNYRYLKWKSNRHALNMQICMLQKCTKVEEHLMRRNESERRPCKFEIEVFFTKDGGKTKLLSPNPLERGLGEWVCLAWNFISNKESIHLYIANFWDHWGWGMRNLNSVPLGQWPRGIQLFNEKQHIQVNILLFCFIVLLKCILFLGFMGRGTEKLLKHFILGLYQILDHRWRCWVTALL